MNSIVGAGSCAKPTYNAKGLVTGCAGLTLADLAAAGGAPLASPSLTGAPTAPTGANGDATTRIATDQFVANVAAYLGTSLSNSSNQASGTLPVARLPALTGDVTAAAGSGTLALAATGVSAGACVKPTVDAKGRAMACGALAASDVTGALAYTPLSTAGGTVNGLVRLPYGHLSSGPYINLGGYTGPQLQSLYGLENSGSMLTGWNMSAGGGETAFVSNRGAGGVGGYSFWDLSNSGVLTQMMHIDPAAGSISVPNLTLQSTTNTHLMISASVSGVAKSIDFQTAGVERIRVAGDADAETGNNAGSDLRTAAYSDTGAFLGSFFTCYRSSLVCDFTHTPTVNGTAISGGSSCTSNCGSTYGAGANISISGSTISVSSSPVFVGVTTNAVYLPGGAAVTYNNTTGKFLFTNPAGQNVASIDSSGNMIVAGQIFQGQTP